MSISARPCIFISPPSFQAATRVGARQLNKLRILQNRRKKSDLAANQDVAIKT